MSPWRDIKSAALCNLRVLSVLRISLVFTGLLCVAGGHAADQPDPLRVTMIPELRVVDHQGNQDHYHYIPARQVSQGEEIYYTVRIVNVTSERIKHAVVVQPVPANTHLIERSVTGAGAIISYSTDGGHTFSSASDVYDVTRAYQKSPVKVTHIRWQFRHPLAPHVVVLARFRVVFD